MNLSILIALTPVLLGIVLAVRSWSRTARNTKREAAVPPPDPPEDLIDEDDDDDDIETTNNQVFDYFLVLDVEGTCKEGTGLDWPNEIIEWPVVILGWRTNDDGKKELTAIDEFRSFVRPTFRPQLSEFCKQLTGISQNDVDAAPTFREVLKSFNRRLRDHGLINLNGKKMCRFVWCSDGPYDLRDFVAKQSFISGIQHPEHMLGEIIDMKLLVGAYIDQLHNVKSRRNHRPRAGLRIPSQLAALELPAFEGREHSGIDDARNISRVIIELSRRGYPLRANYTIRKGRRWPWMGRSLGEIRPDYINE